MKEMLIVPGKQVNVERKICSTFTVKSYYKAEVSVDNTGKYDVVVSGDPHMVNTARRSPLYKPAVAEVTSKMMQSYKNTISSYTELCKQCVLPQSEQLYKDKLVNLSLKTYQKKLFQLNEPTKEAAEVALKEEAFKRFYSLFGSKKDQIDAFIENNVNSLFIQKMKDWAELKDYFEMVESIIEKRENALFLQQYTREKSDLETFVNGPVEFIDKGLKEVCRTISIPVSLSLEYGYEVKSGIISLNVELPSVHSFNIPTNNASLYATGKLSVKSKNKVELAQDLTQFYVCIAFYLSSSIFQLSVNIKKIRMTLWNSGNISGEYWVEFDRERFSQLRYKSMDPLSEFIHFPHIMRISKNNTIEEIMNEELNSQIDQLLSSGGDVSVQG